MKLPGILLRHPALAWIAPSIVVVGLGALAMGAFTSSSSTAPLPETSPQALVAAIRAAANSPTQGYSGTIVVDASLGAPPVGDDNADGDNADGDNADGDNDSDAFTEIFTGSHTLRYWYSGPERQRVAMLRPTSEADFFRDGDNLWEWDSATQTVSHATLVRNSTSTMPITFAALTPQQLLNMVLTAGGADGSDTAVSLGPESSVAGRPCYEMVIAPRSSTATRIGSVHVAIDSATKVPLSVQVYARGSDVPSVDATFSSVTFKRPAASYFAFTPPPSTKSSPMTAGMSSLDASDVSPSAGSGWSTVMEYSADQEPELGALGQSVDALFKPVAGKWGKGELLTSPLLCLLATNDGRIYLGAVDPAELYAAASSTP